eukprot:21348-Heterococcus_DN1.PRE.1
MAKVQCSIDLLLAVVWVVDDNEQISRGCVNTTRRRTCISACAQCIVGAFEHTYSRVGIICTVQEPCNSTPLHLARFRSCATQAATVKVLLAAGADVHVTTSTRDTCLHVAARHSLPVPVVCLLITAGVGLHAVNNHGKTAAQLAYDTGNTLTEQLLIKAVGAAVSSDVRPAFYCLGLSSRCIRRRCMCPQWSGNATLTAAILCSNVMTFFQMHGAMTWCTHARCIATVALVFMTVLHRADQLN